MAFCSGCGKKMNVGAKFCDSCGANSQGGSPQLSSLGTSSNRIQVDTYEGIATWQWIFGIIFGLIVGIFLMFAVLNALSGA